MLKAGITPSQYICIGLGFSHVVDSEAGDTFDGTVSATNFFK